MQTIETAWARLARINEEASWAVPGVFAPAIGPSYEPGSPRSILVVGKSAGPLGERVGSSRDFRSSSVASTSWALDPRSNPRSSFWHFVDRIVGERAGLAWTNLIKMDEQGRDAPMERNARSIWQESREVLDAEFDHLRPAVAVMVTGKTFLVPEVHAFVRSRGYELAHHQIADGTTLCWHSTQGWVVTTRHPQGMPNRTEVVEVIRSLLEV